MFTRLKESFIKSHCKEYSDNETTKRAFRRAAPFMVCLHISNFCWTCCHNEEISKIFFWLELVASILNIDIKRTGTRFRIMKTTFLQQFKKSYIKQGLKEIRTMRSKICYSIVSNFYIDFIPQWGKITDSNDIHFVFICDSHGCFFFLGVLKLSWKKWLFERSFNCFLLFFYLVVGCWNCNF